MSLNVIQKGMDATKFIMSLICMVILIILGGFFVLVVLVAILIGLAEEKAALEEVSSSPIMAKIGAWKTTPENNVVSVIDLLPAQASRAELVQILGDQGFELTDKENCKAIANSDGYSDKSFDQCARRVIVVVLSCVYEYNVAMNFMGGLLSEASGAYRLLYCD